MTAIQLSIMSFSISSIGAFAVIRFAHKIGVLDIPNSRSSHSKVIPKGGGIGILIVVFFCGVLLSIPGFVWIPAVAISLLSLWGGDKHLLSPEIRLILQFICGFLFLIPFFLMAVPTYSLFWAIPAAVFIVGTSNFYNFMDGIDGIAGLTGVIGFLLLTFFSKSMGTDIPYHLFCLTISCACLGFLCFNFPKAKVFLGDLGSILLGFLYSVIVVLFTKTPSDFITMIGFLSLFYMDELFTMVVRLRRGYPLIVAHRMHVYQLLSNELGVAHWKVSLSYGILQLLIGVSLICTRGYGVGIQAALLILYTSIFVTASLVIHKKAKKI